MNLKKTQVLQLKLILVVVCTYVTESSDKNIVYPDNTTDSGVENNTTDSGVENNYTGISVPTNITQTPESTQLPLISSDNTTGPYPSTLTSSPSSSSQPISSYPPTSTSAPASSSQPISSHPPTSTPSPSSSSYQPTSTSAPASSSQPIAPNLPTSTPSPSSSSYHPTSTSAQASSSQPIASYPPTSTSSPSSSSQRISSYPPTSTSASASYPTTSTSSPDEPPQSGPTTFDPTTERINTTTAGVDEGYEIEVTDENVTQCENTTYPITPENTKSCQTKSIQHNPTNYDLTTTKSTLTESCRKTIISYPIEIETTTVTTTTETTITRNISRNSSYTPLPGDEKCTARGGECSTKAECVGGKYVSNLCAGDKNRRCCIKDDPEPEKFNLISREKWGSTVKRCVLKQINLPVSKVFIHHTEGKHCLTKEECLKIVRQIQKDHLKRTSKVKGTNKRVNWIDIGYSFLVGEDGNVYEGRGWDKEGAHTPGNNKVAIAISVMGNFMNKIPNEKALKTVKNLIEYGVANKKISKDYRLFGHKDASNTDCPGDSFYALIKTWPRYGKI